MISSDEALLLFNKWAEERTPIRVSFAISECRVSCDGRIAFFEDERLQFRADPLGFIDVRLPNNTEFDYCSPDAMRVPENERIGEGHMGERIRHGAAVVAVRENGDSFFFIEIEKAQ